MRTLSAGSVTGHTALVSAYLTLSALMLREESRMKRRGAPGIIGLELAGNAARVDSIVAVWGAAGVAAARRSLLIDYGVLATYTPLMRRLCVEAGTRFGRRGHTRVAQAAGSLAGAQLAAGAFDAVENAALLALLSARRGPLPALARGCATLKFVLLGLGLVYVGASLLVTDKTRERSVA